MLGGCRSDVLTRMSTGSPSPRLPTTVTVMTVWIAKATKVLIPNTGAQRSTLRLMASQKSNIAQMEKVLKERIGGILSTEQWLGPKTALLTKLSLTKLFEQGKRKGGWTQLWNAVFYHSLGCDICYKNLTLVKLV